MITKILEIRDSATFIPVAATIMKAYDPIEVYYLRRCGYSIMAPYAVIVTRLENGQGHNNVYDWPVNTRTMLIAHKYIEENFDNLVSGDVIDVQYILGETKIKKDSERLTVHVL